MKILQLASKAHDTVGTSFVTVGRDRSGIATSTDSKMVGFWANDSLLELWLRLLALHIDEPSSASDYGHKIRTQWLLASKHHFPGAVPHDLEEFTASTEGFDIVRKAVNSLSRMIDQSDQPIQHETLNLLGFDALWSKDIAVHELQEIAMKFDDLLESRIFTVASD